MTAKDCLYNIPDETRFVNIFFRANGTKWREIFGRQRYSENVRQVTAPAVELQRPTRPLIRLLNRNKPFPTELFIIGSRQCKQSVGRDALIPPWRNLYRLWQALQMICRIRCSHRADAANRSRGSGRRVRGAFAPEARCGYRNPTLSSILATQMPCRSRRSGA